MQAPHCYEPYGFKEVSFKADKARPSTVDRPVPNSPCPSPTRWWLVENYQEPWFFVSFVRVPTTFGLDFHCFT